MVLSRVALSLWMTLTSTIAAGPGPGSAVRLPVALSAPVSSDTPTAFFGLEGDQGEAGRLLSKAIRAGLAERGIEGGEPLSLEEVRLLMGCDVASSDCLSAAGESMGVGQVVYGTLSLEQGVGRLELHLVDVAGQVEAAQITELVPLTDLTADTVAGTASKVLDRLFPSETEVVPAPVPAEEDVFSQAQASAEEEERAESELPAEATPEPEPVREPTERLESDRSGRVVWGPYKPRPTWKRAGLGVGVSLAVLGGATFITTAVMLRDGGPLQKELVDAAWASLDDEANGVPNTNNDIDPQSDEDICLRAEAPAPGQPGTVTNASVAEVCRKAERYEIANWVGAGVGLAGLVTTVVFTTLLFVRKKDHRRAAVEPRWQLGGGPSAHGWAVQGRLRF